MLIIRFQRRGKKNRPFFKIVLAKKESPPKGKFLEAIGSYDPLTKESIINKERVLYFVEHGAQVSSSVHNLLVRENIIEAAKTRAHSSHLRKKKEKKTSKAKGENMQEEKVVSSKEEPTGVEAVIAEEGEDTPSASSVESKSTKSSKHKGEVAGETKNTEANISKKEQGAKKSQEKPLVEEDEIELKETAKKENQKEDAVHKEPLTNKPT